MNIILDELACRSDCILRAPKRLPAMPPQYQFPDDLAAFYSRFSEARLFGDASDPKFHILPPEQFVQIGIAIYGEPTTDPIQRSWYALAHVQDGNYIAIDCAPARLGYCYDAFHETFHLLDYCQIIAETFTELLSGVVTANGRAFWLASGFKGYGYADSLSAASE